jgi:hypothetical protein
MVTIRDRIIELRRVPAATLRPNPKNWRRHPARQNDALLATLNEIGYAGALLARETEDGGVMLIDGHARAGLTPEAIVPVLILDVDEEEADKLLAVYDPIGAMAETDRVALEGLIGSVFFESDDLNKLLADMASSATPAQAEPPAQFPKLSGDIKTDHRCPSCGFEWSGDPQP